MLPAHASAILRYAGLRNELDEAVEIDGPKIARLRESTYFEQWQIIRQERWYHIALEDHCFFLFQYGTAPSFSFIDCPLNIPTMAEFTTIIGKQYRDRYSAECIEEYEIAIDTADEKKYVTPIRYDFDKKGYRGGVHPVAHLHIGLDNNIRIGLKREMSPLAFLLFVIRQRYPTNWERLLISTLGSKLKKFIRENLTSIDNGFYVDADHHEMYLE